VDDAFMHTWLRGWDIHIVGSAANFVMGC
jgi:hypothetical protein